ncbi:MAG: hypothetical protein KKG35_04795 [Proteobacteria bacterium]|nr:hypothetical protein [Pseudomonadota bacterium]
MSYMGGRLGKVSIIYDRKGTVTFGPENGEILETKQIDPQKIRAYWAIAENVTEKVEPGKYGILRSLGKNEMDIKISICNKLHSYIAANQGKGEKFSEPLSEIFDRQPR